MKRIPHDRHRRRGHSMMEMLVVMSVLAGMATLAWPMLKSPLGKSRLQAAAQEVANALAKARLKAMQSGVAQAFRVQWNSGKFQVAVASEEEETAQSPLPTQEQLSAAPGRSGDMERSPLTDVTDFLTVEKELPDGIYFEAPEAIDVAEAEETEVAADEEGWTELTIFYPNGRTANAVVGLRGDRDFHVNVMLSGLTGVAKIGELRRQELR